MKSFFNNNVIIYHKKHSPSAENFPQRGIKLLKHLRYPFSPVICKEQRLPIAKAAQESSRHNMQKYMYE